MYQELALFSFTCLIKLCSSRSPASSFYKERIRKTEDELKMERVKSRNTVQHLLDSLEIANKKAEVRDCWNYIFALNVAESNYTKCLNKHG